MSIATIAANVAAALAGVATATDAASVVKFDALVDFAATTAIRLRVEQINAGKNLETDGKGRFVALLDISKEQRAALVTAFTGLGVKEKDAANIASMGRTVALHFVPLMVADGSIRDAMSGDRMAEIIRESILTVTAGKATYNAVEQARSRKWTVAEPDTSEDAAPDAAPADVDMSATLDTAPVAPTTEAPASDAATASDALDAETHGAVKILMAALERGDVERVVQWGGRGLAAALLESIQTMERENADLDKASQAA